MFMKMWVCEVELLNCQLLPELLLAAGLRCNRFQHDKSNKASLYQLIVMRKADSASPSQRLVILVINCVMCACSDSCWSFAK
ncbi:hypothetical protein PVAP13_6KG062670 [Panicum virgatum]|uniref:Uncharacterized protein n=1 Tax=Panicum virgatum TaxID=38727 RepID=A0A8T0R9I8_PANVG|nr:hypothetical protein PVAP13_6KG062670 [Panicum virgatum]KAG2581746.1 hypothetical protein PVAP13_6KG062670 [Panicum virgatum]